VEYDVVIIGAGPAGLTAAYELSKSQKKVAILEKKNNVGGNWRNL
jgi:flavin-dependent dehydrogenase